MIVGRCTLMATAGDSRGTGAGPKLIQFAGDVGCLSRVAPPATFDERSTNWHPTTCNRCRSKCGTKADWMKAPVVKQAAKNTMQASRCRTEGHRIDLPGWTAEGD